jgi:hypothetical protein
MTLFTQKQGTIMLTFSLSMYRCLLPSSAEYCQNGLRRKHGKYSLGIYATNDDTPLGVKPLINFFNEQRQNNYEKLNTRFHPKFPSAILKNPYLAICFTNLMLPMLTYQTDYYFPSNMFIIIFTCRG